MCTQRHIIPVLLAGSMLSVFLLSCGSDRVHIGFRTSPDIYSDDSKTDPDKLNRELQYDLKEAEKKRRQKEREEAKAREEAEKKANQGQVTEEETPLQGEGKQPVPQY
ncbi:MAG: hypothetical protein E3K32_01255 [wastewater metagenome]|nr:hypothetical protein [Candidatus Loosdrechtia aerotolerans]